VLERMRTNFASQGASARAAPRCGAASLTGALTGLKADIAAGGMTLGAGLLVGGLIGGLAGAGVARGLNRLSGADEPVVWWSGAFLDGLLRSAVLRYLAVAHFGRRSRQVGRGRGAGLLEGRGRCGARAPRLPRLQAAGRRRARGFERELRNAARAGRDDGGRAGEALSRAGRPPAWR
jgi:hypothetical protein